MRFLKKSPIFFLISVDIASIGAWEAIYAFWSSLEKNTGKSLNFGEIPENHAKIEAYGRHKKCFFE